jgi:hypothetical protein
MRSSRAAGRAERSPPPLLVAMSGLVASGKSTLARAIAAEIAAPVVVADRVRAALLESSPGEALHEAAWQQGDAPGITDVVYAEVFRRADAVLASGRSVVVDACFPTRALRRAAREIAAARGGVCFFFECRADSRTVFERLCARSREDGVALEAWLAIASDFQRCSQPLDELGARELAVLDTAKPLRRSLTIARLRLAGIAPLRLPAPAAHRQGAETLGDDEHHRALRDGREAERVDSNRAAGEV